MIQDELTKLADEADDEDDEGDEEDAEKNEAEPAAKEVKTWLIQHNTTQQQNKVGKMRLSIPFDSALLSKRNR